jgi:AcrR family transcriptional regulator
MLAALPDPSIPAALRMRREPKQQRSQEVALKIEQATLSLLVEQGFFALNTKAIAERAGVGIKSLYHLFPNKEAIIYRLAVDWLEAVRLAQAQICQDHPQWPQLYQKFDEALDELDQRYSGYGPLWRAIMLIPDLQQLEETHEQQQVAFWSACFRRLGCRWPDAELAALATYFYRSGDSAKQCAKESGGDGRWIWTMHRNWLIRMVDTAIAEPDAGKGLAALGLAAAD